MNRALACVIGVVASGCIGEKPAVTCMAGDRACAEVREAMENSRGKLGGWCGTHRLSLRMELGKIGSLAVVHYLEDPDRHLAWAAVNTLRGFGGDMLIAKLCASGYVVLNREICR